MGQVEKKDETAAFACFGNHDPASESCTKFCWVSEKCEAKKKHG